MKYLLTLFCIFLFCKTNNTQVHKTESGILKDTSFTIFSAYEKAKKEFPFIEIAKTNPDPYIRVDSNVVYSNSKERELHLDIYSPEVIQSNLPVVLLIHGGGWKSGDRNQMVPIAKYLALNDYIAVTVEYRLSPEAKYPAAVTDIKKAIKYLKKNHDHFNIDTSRVAILGCSSGGQLAAFVGLTIRNPEYEPPLISEVTSEVQAIVNIDGILDFTHPGESAKDTNSFFPSAGKQWLGYSFRENPELWIEASPLTYIDENTPSILFINSGIERFQAGQSKAVELLTIHKKYFEIHTINNCPHTFWFFHPWFDKTVDIILRFLNGRFVKN